MNLQGQQIRIVFAALAAVLTVATTPTAAAPAGSADTQSQIEAYLAKYPGGMQINSTEISYAEGQFIISLVPTGPININGPDCPSGWFCFYDNLNYGYPRGKLSSCGWQDLTWWGWNDRTESVYYNMSWGSVTFINHGRYPDHTADDPIFAVGTGQRGLSDVWPYRNAADHVYRYC